MCVCGRAGMPRHKLRLRMVTSREEEGGMLWGGGGGGRERKRIEVISYSN